MKEQLDQNDGMSAPHLAAVSVSLLTSSVIENRTERFKLVVDTLPPCFHVYWTASALLQGLKSALLHFH